MEGSGGTRPNVGVLLEQTLGHVSHGRNLKRTLSEAEHASVRCVELPYEPQRRLDSLPPRTNWTLRSSLAARAAVRDLEREQPLDALLVHTHVPATLLGRTMERLPTVVSIDATPKQIDSLGSSYRHAVQPGFVENAKWQMHARCFQQAASLVSWSNWAADSLVADYGVNRDNIEVIPPGVVPAMWRRPRRRIEPGRVVKILFVGGDFERKGGQILVDAVERLRRDPDVVTQGIELELHLVTGADVRSRPGVHVHRGLTPNSPKLIALFHEADIFSLPTSGDCTPLVLAEAATAGLPSVATDVGAIGESVIDSVTGHLVEPEINSLAAGLRPLVVDAEHRLQLGENAAAHAARTMDSEKNALRLLDGVIEAAQSHHATGRVVLTVSGEIASDVNEATEAGLRPLADYNAIADATDASLLDWAAVRRDGCNRTEWIRKVGGNSIAMAYHLYRHRSDYEVIITDGEQVGLPLAALFRLGRSGRSHHVMIGHRLSPTKKVLPTRLLGLADGVDEVLVYCSHQMTSANALFNRSNNRVRLIDFMVDTEFFKPKRALEIDPTVRRPKLCTAGREFRDYPTLIEAVKDLDVELVIASASPWSRRSDNANSVLLPPNVSIASFSQRELRDQLDDSDIVVLPLLDTDFQAGVTTLLEAMAMERPVVCTNNEGQTDVVIDGENGLYVPAGDPHAMRAAIQKLIDNPDLAADMGKRGRELVEERADVRAYASVFGSIVRSYLRGRPDPTEGQVSQLRRPQTAA